MKRWLSIAVLLAGTSLVACVTAKCPEKPKPAPKPTLTREQIRGKVEYIDIVMDPQDASTSLIRIAACGKTLVIAVPNIAFETAPQAVEEFVDNSIVNLCEVGI